MKIASFTTWVICGILLTWLVPSGAMVVVAASILGAVGAAAHLSGDEGLRKERPSDPRRP